MPSFLARYKTRTRRPVRFRTSSGSTISFKARRTSLRRKRVAW